MSDEQTIGRDDGPPTAAEYVLGTLGAQERREFERRLSQEPALRTEVEVWEQRLGGLAAEVKPVDPPQHVLARIEVALDAGDRPRPRNLWESLPFWRWAAIGSTAVAAASLVTLAYVGRAPAPGAPLVAKLDIGSG